MGDDAGVADQDTDTADVVATGDAGPGLDSAVVPDADTGRRIDAAPDGGTPTVDAGAPELDGGCVPTTCDFGECGIRTDSCGGELDCGTCPMSGFVSYVGCSQTRDNTDGYETLGGTRLASWPSGGCSIDRWLDSSSDCWDKYHRSVQGLSPTSGYFQICIRSRIPVSYAQVRSVLELFEDELPAGAPVYVAGLEIFEPEDICSLADGSTQRQTRDFADRLVADSLALRAPDLGPLTVSNTMPDGCHPSRDGRLETGRQLVDFFGR